VYGSFKAKLTKIFAINAGDLNRTNIVSTIMPAFRESFTHTNILAGWRKAAITQPFNPDAVLSSGAVKSAELRLRALEAAKAELAESQAAKPSTSTSSQSSAASSVPPALARSGSLQHPPQVSPVSPPRDLAQDENDSSSDAAPQRLTLLQLANQVAPVLAANKRSRKSRGFPSGHVLT